MKHNLMPVLCAGVFLLVLGLQPAPGADISVTSRDVPLYGVKTSQVVLEGTIGLWDSVVFKRRTEMLTGKVVVTLNSPGGAGEAGISIGTFIHMNGWTTRVKLIDVCDSACALIWIAGANRELEEGGSIGVHSAAIGGGSSRRNDHFNDKVIAYLRSFDVPEEVISRWTKPEPWQMDYLRYKDLLRLKLLSR